MAKICITLFFVFWTLTNASGADLHLRRGSINDPRRVAVLKIAREQIGVYEITGRNDGPQVEEYLKEVNRKKGDAWCAAVVVWIFHKCYIFTIPVTGWSPGLFPADKVIYVRNGKNNLIPLPADVWGMYFADLGRIAHAGIIEVWPEEKNYFISLEGNTSPSADSGQATREGGQYCRKKRPKWAAKKVASYIND